MQRDLKMVFMNTLGKLVTLTLSNIKDNVTAAEVQALMQAILTNNIFNSTGGDLVSIEAASLVTTNAESVAIA